MPRKSARKADRVVRRTLSDGTVKTYRYPAYNRRRKPKGDTFEDLVKAWERSPEYGALKPQTQAGYTHYVGMMGGLSVTEAVTIDRRDIIEQRNSIAETIGRGAATGFVRAVSALFGWAVENGWMNMSPCYKVKRLAGGHLPAWTTREAEAAIANLKEPMRRAVVLALYTGQRRGDLVRMTWADYDGEAIKVRQGKTGALLRIPCHPALRAELDAWRIGRADATTILTRERGKPWLPSNLSKHMQDGLARIPGFPIGRNIHGLRKLAATNLAEAGCTPHEIAAVTGHETLAMVQLYTASVDQERMAEAAIFRLRTNDKKAKKTG